MKIRARVVLLAAFSLAVGAAIFFAAQQRRGEKPAAAQKKSAPPETLAAPGVSGSPASVAPTAAGSAPPAIAKGTPAAPPAAVAAVPSPAPVPAMPAPTPEPVASSTDAAASSGNASMVASVTDAQGAVRELTPDNLGFFPRVYIEPRQVVPVRVNFADGRRDEVAVVRVEDGGRLEGNAPAKTFNLDDKGSIGFAFQANADPGVYHVVVHRGGDERVLDFWVGPRMPAANR